MIATIRFISFLLFMNFGLCAGAQTLYDSLLNELETANGKERVDLLNEMAHDMEPKEIIKYQNDVFGFMIDIIGKHHGIIKIIT